MSPDPPEQAHNDPPAHRRYLYLSVIPEALIVSMLPPEAFGRYYAVGTRQRSRGQAMFFEVARELAQKGLALEEARRRCVPHPDGTPKNSVYVAIYRALEHVPLEALRSLYLTTDDGRVLRLESHPWRDSGTERFRLYQELCPVNPRVASTLDPARLVRFVTAGTGAGGPLIRLPRIAFCDLELGALADDPDAEAPADLPYPYQDHLRDCLRQLRDEPRKSTKMVMRDARDGVLYRTVCNGFFVGDAGGMRYFPMPSRAELEQRHRSWWRSAQMGGAG